MIVLASPVRSCRESQHRAEPCGPKHPKLRSAISPLTPIQANMQVAALSNSAIVTFVEKMLSASDVSVVICAYTMERKDDVLRSIESVSTQTPTPGQVMVVIDYNEELLTLTRTWTSCISDVEFCVVPNTGTRGLSGARNTGIAASDTRVVAFLDDDAAAEPGWIEGLVDGLNQPGVVGLGGPVHPEWDWGGPPWWFPPEFFWVVGCSYAGGPTDRSAIRNPIGANMAFLRSEIRAIGGFHTSIGRVGKTPLGCEETEASIAITSRTPRSRIVFEPHARVRHRVRSERCTVRYFLRRCYAEGISKALVSRLSGGPPADRL